MGIIKFVSDKLFANGKEVMTEDTTLGVNQTWVDETANRTFDVEYTNDTGKPIMVILRLIDAKNNGSSFYVDGLRILSIYVSGGGNTDTCIVPAGAIYKLGLEGSGGSVDMWLELK